MNKAKLRKEFLQKRSSLDDFSLKQINNKIFQRFINSKIYKDSNNIMIYISFDTEVNTHIIIDHIISQGKKVIVPITDSENKKLIPSELHSMNELELGFYNILTPKKEFIRVFNPDDIDLIVVPGIVFDKKGYRIGYGGGYYDRFLKNLSSTYKISLCYDFQLIDSVPNEDYDILIDSILTEKRIIKC